MRLSENVTGAMLIAVIGASLACAGPTGQQAPPETVVGTITAISPKARTVTVQEVLPTQGQQQQWTPKKGASEKPASYTFIVTDQTQIIADGLGTLKKGGSPSGQEQGVQPGPAAQITGQDVPVVKKKGDPLGEPDQDQAPVVKKKKGDPLGEPGSQTGPAWELLQVGQTVEVTSAVAGGQSQKGGATDQTQAGQGQTTGQTVDQKQPLAGQQAGWVAVRIRVLAAAMPGLQDAPAIPQK